MINIYLFIVILESSSFIFRIYPHAVITCDMLQLIIQSMQCTPSGSRSLGGFKSSSGAQNSNRFYVLAAFYYILLSTKKFTAPPPPYPDPGSKTKHIRCADAVCFDFSELECWLLMKGNTRRTCMSIEIVYAPTYVQ